MPEIHISIVGLKPRNMGDEVELGIKIDAVNNSTVMNSESRIFTIASQMLFEIGNIGVNVLPYELTPEQFDSLEYSARLWEVVKKGLDLLSYGDNTRRQLETKLRSRGFDIELCAEAADYIANNGYIDEERMIEQYFRQLAEKKLYGPSRIRQEIMRKGFSRDVVSDKLSELIDEFDFYENLRDIVERKFDFSHANGNTADDRKYRESFIASMFRLGYSPSDVRQVIRDLSEE
ncbi:MAG: regulatory protein RecX [Clostridiales bacterium]|nr:regulatory protein RecX [Clostridiales bacterium]